VAAVRHHSGGHRQDRGMGHERSEDGICGDLETADVRLTGRGKNAYSSVGEPLQCALNT
jgi:hypothetical protein